MQCPQEHLKTIVYAKFGGQTKCIMGNSKIENCSEEDVFKLGWLPTLENTQLNILKLGHRALYNNNWPEYLTLSRHNPSRTLRSSSTPLLQISLLEGTFQDSVANLYNDLPASISSITDYHHFVKESAKILKAKAIMRLA